MKQRKISVSIEGFKYTGLVEISDEDYERIRDVEINSIDLILVIPNLGISIKFRVNQSED